MVVEGWGKIVSASYDQNIRVWDPTTGKVVISMPHAEAQVNAMTFQPNTNNLAVASWQKVRLFDISSPQSPLVGSFEGVHRNITCVGFEPSGHWMFSGGEDGVCRVYNTRSIHFSVHHSFQVSSPITSIILINGAEFFIADQGGNVSLWDLSKPSDGTEVFRLPMPKLTTMEFVVKLAVHPAGHTLTGITNRGFLITWSLTPADPEEIVNPCIEPSTICNLTDFRQVVNAHGLSLRYTPEGEYLVITFSNNHIYLFKSQDYNLTRYLDAQSDWNWDVLFTKDTRKMFTGGHDHKVKVWDFEKGTIISKFDGHVKPITALCLTEN
ncbi:unnamed protein product [Auanema sp. JU1783]|nr:unnamed protein product [Auanema sp. JU1783]